MLLSLLKGKNNVKKLIKIIWEYPVFEKHPMLMAFTAFIWYPIGSLLFLIYKIIELPYFLITGELFEEGKE